jgi:hypothetical protein
MAINDFKNIENINLNLDSTAQIIESKDLTIFKTGAKNITDFGMSKNDVIEFRIYDISNNLLQQTNGINVRYIHKNDLPKYLKSDIDKITQEKIFDIDVEKLVREAGYGNGEFKVSFNFVKNYVGNEDKKQRVWIHEISPSRSEIRVMPLLGDEFFANQKITKRYNAFLEKANELREVVNIIENAIDSIENNISDLIDNYFVSKHGQNWLNIVLRDYQFNNTSYKAFKQKIFTDFKNSVYYQFSGKYFDINESGYGNNSSAPFDLDEFYTSNEIYGILGNRLNESINYNATTIAQYNIPQSIKEITQQDTDSQLLQSLLNTNYTAKSNLTENNKLGAIKKDVVIIDTTPVDPKDDDIIIKKPNYPSAGTLIKKYCEGYDQYGTYADGNGGTYNNIIEVHSLACGYVTPGGGGYSGGGGGGRLDGRGYEPGGQFDTQSLQEFN